MKTRRLLQLLASFAAPRGLQSFSCRRFPTVEPAVRLGSRPASSDGDFEEREDAPVRHHDGGRRSLLHSAGLSLAGTISSGPLAYLLRILYADDSNVANERLYGYAGAARAMGLVHFPCPPGTLLNSYHLMRAGESGLEAEGVLSTNPLFLTNREDKLTDLGTVQVEMACNAMMSQGVNPSVVKYSLAAKCIDAANIVATKMMVGRNRIVPEFTYMDPRGAGLWDGRPMASTEAAIWALDASEAGKEGRDGRPPPNDDGTANETLYDQFIRLRQLMSILETQYSGDSILLIFPDGTSPALLSCLIAGIPLKHTHALNFMPGEVRMGVDMKNANALWNERVSSPTYAETIAKGREELAALRREEDRRTLLAMEEESNRSSALEFRRESAPDESRQMERRRHRARRPPRSASAPGGSRETEGRRRRASGDGSEAKVEPDYVSAAAVGAVGYMATRGAGDKDDASGGAATAPRVAPAPSPDAAVGAAVQTTARRAGEEGDASEGAETAPRVAPAPSLDAAAAVGATGRATARREGDKDDPSDEAEKAPRVAPAPSLDRADPAETAPVLAYENSTGAVAGGDAPDPCLDALDARAEEFAAMPEIHILSSTDADGAAQVTPTNVFDANTGTLNPNLFEDVPLVSNQDRIEAAEKAMEEYLSRDDGGDDWLHAMKGIMEE